MKILILSCNTGEGHNSTAKAIKEEAEERGDTVEIWDALSFWPRGTNAFICQGQEFLYKNLPDLFGFGYRLFEKYSERENKKREKGKKPSPGFSPLAKKPSEKLHDKIAEGGFDVIVCVHIFASLMVTEYRKKFGKEQPVYLIATDYTCSPGANFSDIEGCFTPAEGLTDEFISLGVKPEHILPVGIPVKNEFYVKNDKGATKDKLGLPSDKRTVLLMSGSMGCGPIAKTVESILTKLPEDCILVAVCGRNEKLLTQLKGLAEANSSLYPVGFTKKIPFYMDAADIIVTKAGGLSSTEAGTKNLPIVFIDAIPGLEVHNRDYFVSKGYAVYGNDPEDIALKISSLLNSPDTLETMRANMARDFTHRAATEILDILHK